MGRGILLVDENGKPCNNNNPSVVTVKMANTSTTTSTSKSQQRGSASSSFGSRQSSSRSSTMAASSNNNPLADANNELLIQYGLMALGALILLKIVFAAINMLAILLIPALYLYASANCPANDTFEAKRELKRVMRGAHLPEEHQPKGFFEQGFNRLAASVTTELATSLGYEISMTDVVGVAKMACVKVPIASSEYYWVGILGEYDAYLIQVLALLSCFF